MSDQINQPTQGAQTSEELKQRMHERFDASKKAVEELSDEELEAVAGGAALSTVFKWGMRAADVSMVTAVSAVAAKQGKKFLKGLKGGA